MNATPDTIRYGIIGEFVAAHFGFDLPELETVKVDGVPGWL